MGRVGKDREISIMPEQSTGAASATAPSREHFASRLGFILISAGCAIGLGNVWRFPYITGQYGGAAFFLIYLVFLVILGLPVMVMEFAVGRASQKSAAQAFDRLQPSGAWHWFSWWGYIGCTVLMMFYTTVCGWMLSYVPKMASGVFGGADAQTTAAVFSGMLADPVGLIAWMVVAVVVGAVVCGMGLQKGVERITKWMMATLFVVMLVLCVRAVTLPGAEEGLEFYLMPDFGKLFAGNTPAEQWATFGDAVYAALGQAFFTVSVGMGSMAIFGSYIGKDRRLTGEAVRVGVLDTLVALMAGLVIFPSCFAFGVEPASGPSLVFITLPIVFNAMPLGQLWGTLFFLFMSFAALSTVIAVFETIMAFSMDQWGVRREKACLVNGALIALLSIPCVLGFNVLSGVAIPGIGDIQSIEDFLVSNNILPLGGLFLVMFVTSKRGWGWKNFLAEADTGEGLRFPAWSYRYMKYVLPVGIVIIFVLGYAPIVSTWLGVS